MCVKGKRGKPGPQRESAGAAKRRSQLDRARFERLSRHTIQRDANERCLERRTRAAREWWCEEASLEEAAQKRDVAESCRAPPDARDATTRTSRAQRAAAGAARRASRRWAGAPLSQAGLVRPRPRQPAAAGAACRSRRAAAGRRAGRRRTAGVLALAFCPPASARSAVLPAAPARRPSPLSRAGGPARPGAPGSRRAGRTRRPRAAARTRLGRSPPRQAVLAPPSAWRPFAAASPACSRRSTPPERAQNLSAQRRRGKLVKTFSAAAAGARELSRPRPPAPRRSVTQRRALLPAWR